MTNVRRTSFAFLVGLLLVGMLGCGAEGGGDVDPSDSSTDAVSDVVPIDSARLETASADSRSAPDVAVDAGTDSAVPVDATDTPAPTSLDLHEATLFDNPADLADWPITTTLTVVEFRPGEGGVHVEFSKRDGDGSWPDITPPGWDGPLEYTLGFAEKIEGKWYASAAIQLWRGLDASGGNVAEDSVTKAQCTMFGAGSSCQVGKNWYYDGRWGKLATYQPATDELIGVFVVAGNVRGVPDGSQSPVHERSNVVLLRMPTIAGAKYTF